MFTTVPTAGNPEDAAGKTSEQEAPMQYADVVKVVSKTVRDVDRRKRNVIISGLTENDTALQDAETTIDLAREVFHLDLRECIINCKRIGQSSPTTPRRLLVTFISEATASELLLRAPMLRDFGNGYLSNNVFINRDLSREEAHESYLRRQERRERLAAETVEGASRAPFSKPNTAKFHRKFFYRSAPITHTHTHARGSMAVTSQFSELPLSNRFSVLAQDSERASSSQIQHVEDMRTTDAQEENQGRPAPPAP